MEQNINSMTKIINFDCISNNLGKLQQVIIKKTGLSSYQIQEQYTYGIQFHILNLVTQLIQKYIFVLDPESQRFLILINYDHRQLRRIDLRSLKILQSNKADQFLYRLQKNKYIMLDGIQKLIIIFENKEQKEKRLNQLKFFQKKNKIIHTSQTLNSAFIRLFFQTKKNANQQIHKKQVQQFLTQLSFTYSKIQLQTFFNIITKCKQFINKSQFILLIQILSIKTQLFQLFQSYYPLYNDISTLSSKQLIEMYKQPSLTKDNFLLFLHHQQQTQHQEIYQISNSLKWVQDRINFQIFSKFIFSNQNSIIDHKKTKIHQNMNLPMTQYYVHSSHNTYLTGNQLTSHSKCSRYLQDLSNGIRCLQIDIHDGDDGPIVKHGFTITTMILFQDVIEAIASFSLQNQGHFPIILSFQNHCNYQNHKKILQILNQKLKDKIYKIPENCNSLDRFPTPNQLLNKIVIQGTGQIINIRPHINQQYSQNQNLKTSSTQDSNQEANKNIQLKLKNKQQTIECLNKQQLQQLYSIFVKNVDISQTCWEMGNLSQGKSLKLHKRAQQFRKIVQFTKKCWLRVYPQGFRFGSSNFNPLPMYEMGAQLVSLNTQRADAFNLLMKGMFMQNGFQESGYILKPQYLRNSLFQKPEQQYELTIKVLSSINILNQENQIPNSIRVFFCFFGSQRDMTNNRNEQMIQVTQTVYKVSYHTIFTKNIQTKYIVKDIFFANLFIEIPECGSISIPFRLMRNGYRVIPLMNINKQFKKESYVLAQVKLKWINTSNKLSKQSRQKKN